jgi:hypothetical protein
MEDPKKLEDIGIEFVLFILVWLVLN